MRIDAANSDEAVLGELGRRLARTRLDRNLTQQQMANDAGVSRATIERLEAGDPIKSSSLVRVLRSLGLLDALDRLIPEPLPSPVERLQLQGRRRRRARTLRGDLLANQAPGPWRWGDEPGPDETQ